MNFDEPFIRLFSQGHIIAGQQKMSKSRGNVVSPDQYVTTIGADVVRCYLMFLGPWDQGGEWNEAGFNGMSRWMNRIWELARRDISDLKDETADEESEREVGRVIHKTIKRVTEDVERFKFNTAVASLMEYTNFLNRIWERRSVDAKIWQDAIGKLLLLLAPIAPHISEELWEQTGRDYSVHNQRLPEWDPELAADEVVTMVVQVNGRLRDRIEVSVGITEEAAKELALGSERVKSYIEGMTISNVVYVRGKLVNVVAK